MTTKRTTKAQEEATAQASPKSAQESSSVRLVFMVNQDGKTADVHPSEVENYKRGGWMIKGGAR